MDKIKFVKSRFETSRGYQLDDGRIIAIEEVVNGNTVMAIRFDTCFNLETGEIDHTFYPHKKYNGKDGLPDYAPEGFTTLNNLKAQKNGHEVHCYDEYNIDCGYKPNFGEIVAKYVAYHFKKQGFNVTVEALMHNYHAWLNDMKSGYRDEKNGYHLFSPCGHNSLSFSATTLHELCKNWQTTYEA